MPVPSDWRCAHCGTLLPPHAELCDECGGSDLQPLAFPGAWLVAQQDDRGVAFALSPDRTNVIGRASPGSTRPEVDLTRLSGSQTVHRRHARLEWREGRWRITHEGRNPLVIQRAGIPAAVQPGATADVQSGDWIGVGSILLQFIASGTSE